MTKKEALRQLEFRMSMFNDSFRDTTYYRPYPYTESDYLLDLALKELINDG